jgi:hypothetical protein
MKNETLAVLISPPVKFGEFLIVAAKVNVAFELVAPGVQKKIDPV